MAEPLSVDTTSVSQSIPSTLAPATATQTSLEGVVEVVNDGDGPLAVLEVNDEIPKLTYPENLGRDPQLKYAMRITVFRQVNDNAAIPVITPNSFDYSYKASQEGKINADVFNLRAGLAVGAAGLAAGALNVISEFSKNTKLSGIAGALGGAATSAVQLGAAGTFAEGLEGGFLQSGAVTTDTLAYINLYMPEGMNFVDRQDYDAVSVTDALGNLGAIALGSGTEIAARLAEGARVGPISLLGQNIVDLALYNQGYALNPQLQVLYRGAKNREFVFTFRFVPRNRKEAATVESIVRTLRYHAAPNFETPEDSTQRNSRYFIPPSQFEIEFAVLTESASYINSKLPRIAKCVLSNIDVDYAPQGMFAAYEDFQPIETRVQLTFTETTILTKSDIQNGY